MATLDDFIGERLPYSLCPEECPEDCYRSEPLPGRVCMVCGDWGVMWQSHARPWSPCGYCAKGRGLR